jgi:hypothetical protein
MKRTEQVVAILTIQGPLNSPKARLQVAEWLMDQADFVEDEGHHFAKRFRARFLRMTP